MAGTDDWIDPRAKDFFGLLPPVQSAPPVAPPDSWAGQPAPLPEYRYTPPIPPQQFLSAIGAPAAPDAMTAAPAPPVSQPALSGPVAPPPVQTPLDDSLHPGETGDQYAERIRIKNQSDIGASFDVATKGLQQIGAYGIGALGQAAEGTAIGDALGVGEVRKWGMDTASRLEQEMQPYQEGRITQVEQVKGIGDAGRLMAWSVGQILPSAIESIGMAAIGAAVGAGVPGAMAGIATKAGAKSLMKSQIAKHIAKEMAEKQVSREVAEQTAMKALAPVVGAGIATYANNYAIGFGDVFGETVDPVTGKGDVVAAAVTAIPYMAIDSFFDISTFNAFAKGAGGAAGGSATEALARYAKAMLSTGTKQGASEAAQEAILMLAGTQAGKEYDQETVMSRLGNSFAVSFLGGGVLGVGAGRKGLTDQERDAGTLSALATVGLRTAGENAPALNMALGNANADPAQRMNAAAQVDAALRGDGLEDLADLWRPMAEKAIKAKEPIQPTSVQAVAEREAARAVAAKQAAIRKGVAEGAKKAVDQAEQIAEIDAGRKRAAAVLQPKETPNVWQRPPEGAVPQRVEPTETPIAAPPTVAQLAAMVQPSTPTQGPPPTPGPDVALPQPPSVPPSVPAAVVGPDVSAGAAPVTLPVTMPQPGETTLMAAAPTTEPPSVPQAEVPPTRVAPPEGAGTGPGAQTQPPVPAAAEVGGVAPAGGARKKTRASKPRKLTGKDTGLSGTFAIVRPDGTQDGPLLTGTVEAITRGGVQIRGTDGNLSTFNRSDVRAMPAREIATAQNELDYPLSRVEQGSLDADGVDLERMAKYSASDDELARILNVANKSAWKGRIVEAVARNNKASDATFEKAIKNKAWQETLTEAQAERIENEIRDNRSKHNTAPTPAENPPAPEAEGAGPVPGVQPGVRAGVSGETTDQPTAGVTPNAETLRDNQGPVRGQGEEGQPEVQPMPDQGGQDREQPAEQGGQAADEAGAVAEASPERTALIERIVVAARLPANKIVPIKEFEWSDGKWRGMGNIPQGGTTTGASRIAGYAQRTPDGATVGTIKKTEAEASALQQTQRDARDESFRSDLVKMGPAALQRQAEYWLKEKAPVLSAAKEPESGVIADGDVFRIVSNGRYYSGYGTDGQPKWTDNKGAARKFQDRAKAQERADSVLKVKPAVEPVAPATILTDFQAKKLSLLASRDMDRSEAMLRSMSGADQAESEFYIIRARAFRKLANGDAIDPVVDAADAEWRAYAAEQKQKVDKAGKISRGPSSGQSMLGHKWVPEEKMTRPEGGAHLRDRYSWALSDAAIPRGWTPETAPETAPESAAPPPFTRTTPDSGPKRKAIAARVEAARAEYDAANKAWDALHKRRSAPAKLTKAVDNRADKARTALGEANAAQRKMRLEDVVEQGDEANRIGALRELGLIPDKEANAKIKEIVSQAADKAGLTGEDKDIAVTEIWSDIASSPAVPYKLGTDFYSVAARLETYVKVRDERVAKGQAERKKGEDARKSREAQAEAEAKADREDAAWVAGDEGQAMIAENLRRMLAGESPWVEKADTRERLAYTEALRQFLEGDLAKQKAPRPPLVLPRTLKGVVPQIVPVRVKQVDIGSIDQDAAMAVVGAVINKEDVRPALRGVYLDNNAKVMAATDGHRIAVLRDAPIVSVPGGGNTAIVGEDGKQIEEKFPQWERIVPDLKLNAPRAENVPAPELLAIANGLMRAEKTLRVGQKTAAGWVGMPLVVDGVEVMIAPKYVADAMTMAIKLGADTVTLQATDADSVLIIESEANGRRLSGRIMPIRFGNAGAEDMTMAPVRISKEGKIRREASKIKAAVKPSDGLAKTDTEQAEALYETDKIDLGKYRLGSQDEKEQKAKIAIQAQKWFDANVDADLIARMGNEDGALGELEDGSLVFPLKDGRLVYQEDVLGELNGKPLVVAYRIMETRRERVNPPDKYGTVVPKISAGPTRGESPRRATWSEEQRAKFWAEVDQRPAGAKTKEDPWKLVEDAIQKVGLTNSEMFEIGELMPEDMDKWTAAQALSAAVKVQTDGRKARTERTKAELIAANGGQPIGLEVKNEGAEQWAVILPDATEPGKFRSQRFDARGFYSHSTRDTADQALTELIEDGFTEPSQGAMDRLSQTKEWSEGSDLTARIQKENAESWMRSQREKAAEPEPFNPANHILIAADSIERLRPQDVERLFDEAPDAAAVEALRAYIVGERPDLKARVDEAAPEPAIPPADMEVALAAARIEAAALSDTPSTEEIEANTSLVKVAQDLRSSTTNLAAFTQRLSDAVGLVGEKLKRWAKALWDFTGKVLIFAAVTNLNVLSPIPMNEHSAALAAVESSLSAAPAPMIHAAMVAVTPETSVVDNKTLRQTASLPDADAVQTNKPIPSRMEFEPAIVAMESEIDEARRNGMLVKVAIIDKDPQWQERADAARAKAAAGESLSPLEIAFTLYGDHEYDPKDPNSKKNPNIQKVLDYFGSRLSQDLYPWCAPFISYVYARSGVALKIQSSRAFLHAKQGEAVSLTDVREGDLLVMRNDNPKTGGWNGSGGHVAFVVKREKDVFWGLGGNQADAVNVSLFHADRVLGALRIDAPSGRAISTADMEGAKFSGTPVVSPTGRVKPNESPRGVSIADVQEMVSTFGNWLIGATASRLPVRVFATQAQAFGPGSVDKEGRIKGAFLPNSRQIILIAENLDSLDDARTVLRHEAVGHYGTLLLSKEDKAEFLNKIREVTQRNRSLGRLWRQIEEAERPGLLRRLKEATPAEQIEIAADYRMRIAEEVFARTAESGRTNLGVTWDKLLVWLRGVLRKYGLIEGRFGPADMRLMAADFAKGIREGREQKIFPETDRAQFAFAGERAQTADKMALETAQARLAVGDDAETVRKETGWFKGDDGKWRFEIDDSVARLTPNYAEFKGIPAALSDVLEHPALFAAYPGLRDVGTFIEIGDGYTTEGSYNAERHIVIIKAATEAKVLSGLVHELQHDIQHRENFATGGNLEMFQPGSGLVDLQNLAQKEYGRGEAKEWADKADKALADKKIPEAIKANGIAMQHASFQAYQRLSGEVESRNVQTRQGMTAAERRAKSPNETRDVPASDVIVVWNGKEMASAPRPENAGPTEDTRLRVKPTVAQGRIRRSFAEIREAAESMSSWKNWYDRHQQTISDAFGEDASLFTKLLSATSQAASVATNVGLAIKAYQQYLEGVPFTGYLPAVIKNLDRIRAEASAEGAKIAQFSQANEGASDAIAVDRHIAQYLFNTTRPTTRQIASAKSRIMKAANQLSWEPRQLQAALWAFNQVRTGTDPAKVQSYDKIIEARRDRILAIRAEFGRGPGGGLQPSAGDAGGALFSRTPTLQSDAAEQTAYLEQNAKRLGYADPDELLVKNPAEFISLAEQWRDGHPRTDERGAVMFSRVVPDWVEPMSATYKEAAARLNIIKDKQTVGEWLADVRLNFGKKMIQGVFDGFAPIKEFSSPGYMLARLSNTAPQGTLEAAFMNGLPTMGNDGALDVTEDMRHAFLPFLRKFNGEHDRFFGWVAGNRADEIVQESNRATRRAAQLKTQIARLRHDRLEAIKAGQSAIVKLLEADIREAAKHRKTAMEQAGITERNLSAGQIVALQESNQGQMDDGTDREAFYNERLVEFNAMLKAYLDVAEKAGLIDGASRHIWERDFYVPFYRDIEEGRSGPTISSGLGGQYAFKRLKGGPQATRDLLENIVGNWSHLLAASAKNRAMQEVAKDAVATGIARVVPARRVRIAGKKPNYITYRDNGREINLEVDDPMLFNALAAVNYTGLKGPVMTVLSKAKRYLTVGVTANPAFKFYRNLMRDSVTSIAVSELGYVPWKNAADGIKALNSPLGIHLMAGGGQMRFGSSWEGEGSLHIRRLIDAGVDPNTILSHPDKILNFWKTIWEKYQEAGDRVENMNRAALYKLLREQGKSHLEASYAALDLMDFSLHGIYPAVRLLTQIVPFMNARLQGLYKLGRAAHENPKRMATVAGAATLASIALLLAYKDDDDWKKREDWDRENFYWFKVGQTAFRIPMPFELGAIGSIVERGLETFIADDFTKERFFERLGAIVGYQLSMNPVPQLVKPMLDVYANRDSFTGRPIETMGMERLQPQDRYTERTSEVARQLGKANVLSPAQIDHLIRGYFGWVGATTTLILDQAARPAFGRPSRPEVPMRSWTGGIAEDLANDPVRSRYVSQFYDQAAKIEQAYASQREAARHGDFSRAGDFDANAAALAHAVGRTKKILTSLNTRKKEVERDVGMSPAAKAREIARLNERMSEVAERVMIPE